MKSLMILVLSLAFTPLFANAACPELAGSYSCRYGLFSKRVVVSQTVRGGTTIYQVDNGGEVFADGIRHQTPTLHPLLDSKARNYSYIARCSTNKLAFEGIADLVRGGQGDVEGHLIKNGTGVNIRMRLVTPDSDKVYDLTCTP